MKQAEFREPCWPQAWGDPADVAAAHGAMLAFLQRCGLARHLRLVPVEPGTEPPNQASSLPMIRNGT